MRNSPVLPLVSIALALVLALAAIWTGSEQLIPLSELQIGAMAGALTLVVYGVQGLVSVATEGQELRPGFRPPLLTNVLSAVIVVVSLLLFADSVLLGYGIVTGRSTTWLGVAAGAGCLFLAALLLLYKEAFLGDEARFDNREDGIPW